MNRSDSLMGCDIVVALGRATVEGFTLFGQNSSGRARVSQPLILAPGRGFAPGEKLRADCLEIPQARQTFTVLASQPSGRWGYVHGVNEHGLAAGCTAFPNKLRAEAATLSGTDLVRLVLERCRTAVQAVDLVSEMLDHHGQGAFPNCPPESGADHAVMIADSAEAYLFETAGRYWVYQEIEQVRAVSNLCTIRQDWDRISPGLGSLAIERGWWPGDGSKLDFADALAQTPVGEASALRRWGRATLLLEQQNGHIDAEFLRRVLGDHYEGTHFEIDPLAVLNGPAPLCQHGNAPGAVPTAASMIACLGVREDRLPMVGCAFGPPCLSVYFPVFLDGALPEAFSRVGPETVADTMNGRIHRLNERVRSQPQMWSGVRERMAALQEEFDTEAKEVQAEGAALKLRGERAGLEHLTTAFMLRNLEQFDTVLAEFNVRTPAALTPALPMFEY
jgi:secernin